MIARPPDETYTAYWFDMQDMEAQVRSGVLENYDWTIHYDDLCKIYYEVRVWRK